MPIYQSFLANSNVILPENDVPAPLKTKKKPKQPKQVVIKEVPQPEIAYQPTINKVFDFNIAKSGFSTSIDSEAKLENNQSLSKNELQFFDSMRETIDNEKVYSVVMKLFDMYVSCVMGADELFLSVEDIMEEYESNLFDMFKNIVLSREVRRRQDSWFCKNIKD